MNELKTASLADVEEEKLRKKCRSCNSLNIVLVRLQYGVPSQALITVCSNELCFRYVDVLAVEAFWRRTKMPV